jgi:hypothetical protein
MLMPRGASILLDEAVSLSMDLNRKFEKALTKMRGK